MQRATIDIGLRGLLGLWLVATGCSRVTINIDNRPCDADDGCAADYTCDKPAGTDLGTCITTGNPCADGTPPSPCFVGETTCDRGCRVCITGAWSACNAIVNEECPAGTIFCAGNILTVCDATGTITAETPCDKGGCDDRGAIVRCNECPPGQTSCDGLDLVRCDADGNITELLPCEQSSRCQGAGVCNAANNRCDITAQADNGTPCDEGAGADGDFCNSTCLDGVCIATGNPVCNDNNGCTEDFCDSASGCDTTLTAAGTPCVGTDSDKCTSTCDGAGVCDMNAPVDCGDDGLDCTDDRCIGPGSCPHTRYQAAANQPCRSSRDPLNVCDSEEVCDGNSDTCPSDVVASAGISCGSSQASDCTAADECDGAGMCDPKDASNGAACIDCPGGGLCDSDGCFLGECLACDGSSAAKACVTANDCTGCDGPCTIGTCLKLEQQACADDIGTSPLWGDGAPCESVVCESERVGYDWVGAVGTDCAAHGDGTSVGKTAKIVYTFNTISLEMPFNIWMRNIADQNHEPAEFYDCSVTGSVPDPYRFTFVEADATTRYGAACDAVGNNGEYCWMAVDGDDVDTNGYQPVVLVPGEHTLTCEITTGGDNDDREPSGFDGFIFTNDLDYVPDRWASDPPICSDQDAAFTAGNCPGTNWPAPAQPDPNGRCRWQRQPPDTDCGSACPRTTGCICDSASPPDCVND